MIEWPEYLIFHQLVERCAIDCPAGARLYRPLGADFDFVIMAVPIRVVAFSVYLDVLRFLKIRGVQAVRGRETIFARHANHAVSPK